MSEEGTNEEVVEQQAEQQETSVASKRKTLSLGERIKVVDYLRSRVEPIVADSNAAVVAIVSEATKVELSWQHLKYMIDDPTMTEWNLGFKIHVKSPLRGEDASEIAVLAEISNRHTDSINGITEILNNLTERILSLENGK